MDGRVFASLAVEPKYISPLVRAIESAVAASFRGKHGSIIIPGRVTQAEQKRRVNACLDILKVLRGDMQWSWQRAIDHLPGYLDKKLTDNDWEPAKRAAWAPQQQGM